MGTVTKNIRDYLSNLFSSSAYHPASIALELILIGIVVYAVLRFLHGTRGARLLQGLLSLLVVGLLVLRVLADQADLERIKQLYQPLVWTVFLTTLIVFQPELRRGLMRIGETGWRRGRASDIDRVARPIATACSQLSKNKIGALIAIERDIGLGGLTDDGVKLDARLTSELLNTIFWPGSALHDLGVVIQHGRITAAGCQFPMVDAEGLDPSIGSRHRAAIGLSLDSDAVVVVVSEETGIISIAVRGELHRHVSPEALLGILRRQLGHDIRNQAKASLPRATPAGRVAQPVSGAEIVRTKPASGDRPPVVPVPEAPAAEPQATKEHLSGRK